MSGCRSSRYGYTGTDECSRNRSASIFYFISTIVAMIVLGTVTVLFFCCIYYKRRRIHERIRNARSRAGQQSAAEPVMYVWPGAADEAPQTTGATPQATQNGAATEAANISKGMVSTGAESVSCVIMAGEERPTHLARPLPREDFVDVNLDKKLDELERGKPPGQP